ncbi:MAG: hypothetical protein DWQ37_17925 [Planctomycetota bacterium]|nr:MAG: hypothetical protein DWQ37_17925 [Planctomycetota bacterium]
MTTALIQAGGKSQRMRRTLGPTHKALVPVLGVPILERNLCQLLVSGFEHVVIVTSQAEGDIAQYVETRGTDLATARGASIECLVEPEPLGTIGAVGLLPLERCPILVTYSDNITSLDMRALVRRHEDADAAMTLATHEFSFQIPFGEVVARDGRIVDYREKSVHPVWISSGTYVVGRKALESIGPGERIDSPHLVHRMLEGKEIVADFPHAELWIDVNDADRLADVERLVAEHPQQLEWLAAEPDRHGWLMVRTRAGRLHREVHSSDNPPADLGDPLTITLTTFDEIDPRDGKIVRYRVELLRAAQAEASLDDWLEPDEAQTQFEGRALRAIAYAARYVATTPPAG